jgi:site-specific DNA recombinase
MATRPRNRNKVKQAALPTTAARVGLYLRVSTEAQAEDGNGLEAQRAALLARCEREHWTDLHEYVDAGISGKSTNRPEFQRMMSDARAGAIHVVVAAKLDRIARNTVDFLQTADELQKVGCRLVMLEPDIDYGTPTGQVMATMFAAFAQWERTLIGARVMSGKTEQAKTGEFNGSPIPFGYTADWQIVESEAVIVRRIFSEFLAGKTFKAIAKGLNAEGITTRRGAHWQHPQVKHIVRNGTYAGLRQWNGQTTPAADGLPAIVDIDTWNKAEARQTRRGKPTA